MNIDHWWTLRHGVLISNTYLGREYSVLCGSHIYGLGFCIQETARAAGQGSDPLAEVTRPSSAKI